MNKSALLDPLFEPQDVNDNLDVNIKVSDRFFILSLISFLLSYLFVLFWYPIAIILNTMGNNERRYLNGIQICFLRPNINQDTLKLDDFSGWPNINFSLLYKMINGEIIILFDIEKTIQYYWFK